MKILKYQIMIVARGVIHEEEKLLFTTTKISNNKNNIAVNIMNINVHDNIFNVKVKSQEIDVVNVEPREANNAYNRAPHLCK